MCQFQYRITVDGTSGPVLNSYPGAQWARIAPDCEERGLVATFERRLITDDSIVPLLSDATGFLTLKGRVICPWECIAAFNEDVE